MFLQSTKIELPLKPTGKPESLGFLNEGIEADIDMIDKYLYGSYNETNWWEKLLVNTSNSENYTVYYIVGAD